MRFQGVNARKRQGVEILFESEYKLDGFFSGRLTVCLTDASYRVRLGKLLHFAHNTFFFLYFQNINLIIKYCFLWLFACFSFRTLSRVSLRTRTLNALLSPRCNKSFILII